MSVKQWQMLGVVFTLLVGTLLHFTYEWSGGKAIVAFFSAVNESTWEHLKLLYSPVILFGVVEYFAYGKKVANFIPVKVISLLMGMGAIVIFFYTYVGVIGQHFLWVDIGTFVLGTVVAYLFAARFLQTDYIASPRAVAFGWMGLCLLLLSFALFTPYPPRIGLFADPLHFSGGR